MPSRILLISINPNWRYSNLGVDQIAGYLRKNNCLVDIKYYHRKERYDDIVEDLDIENRYDFIGLSVHSANYELCSALGDYIKTKDKNAVIFWGGYFPTMFYNELISENRTFDYIVLGDGEIPILNMIRSEKADIDKLENIVSKRVKTAKVPYYNKKIDYLPVFDYYEKDSIGRNRRKIYCLQVKNNVCTGNCSFCTERKGQIKYKDLDFIISEIKHVVDNFGVNQFFFTDDNIMDPNNDIAKNFIRNLCMKLKELNYNIGIKCYIKANSFRDTAEDNDLLELMSEVGFATMFIGIEAGNAQDLKLYNKYTTIEDNYRIIDLLRKHNLEPIIGFINLNPYSTLKTLKENFQFLLDIECGNIFQYVGTVISLQKYTALYNKLKEDKLLKSSYSYINNMEYEFKNSEIRELAKFILEEIRPKVLRLDMEIDTLLQVFQECKRVDESVEKYAPELEIIKQRQLANIKKYFSYLYIDNDIELCREKMPEFFDKFCEDEKIMMDYYWKFIELMINAQKLKVI